MGMSVLSSKKYLYEHLKKEFCQISNVPDEEYLRSILYAWMNDKENSGHRFDVIKKYLPNAKRILDMSAGCGTFVFYGLINGYDVDGIEPEEWKLNFNKLKAVEKNYPSEWLKKISKCYGESLPYRDKCFDVVSTYQTLEHVQNVELCLAELLRVTKNGGGVHIQCPDYRSTYEPHYRIPYFPLMPRSLAKIWLRLNNKNSSYLNTINYVTSSKIKKIIRRESYKKSYMINIVDLNRVAFIDGLKKKRVAFFSFLYPVYITIIYFKRSFRSEMQTNILVYKE